MISLSSLRQDTQVLSWLHKTRSSNSFPPHPFPFPRVSSLAFAASFLPPLFISIFLNFLGYARGKYLVLQPRFYRLPRVRQLARHSVWSHIFSRYTYHRSAGKTGVNRILFAELRSIDRLSLIRFKRSFY